MKKSSVKPEVMKRPFSVVKVSPFMSTVRNCYTGVINKKKWPSPFIYGVRSGYIYREVQMTKKPCERGGTWLAGPQNWGVEG